MGRTNISSGSKYEQFIGFSRAVKIGNTIAVAGTAPLNEDGTTANPGNLYLQTHRCLEIMKESIEEAGGSLTDVIRTRIYLKDISHWEVASKAHGEIFSQIKPACTFIEVSRFIGKEWLVETEADCVLSN